MPAIQRVGATSACFLTALILCITCESAHGDEEDSAVVFYSYSEIANLTKEGIKIPKSGTYAVWVWAPEDSFSQVRIGSKDFSPVKQKKPQPGFFWTKLGTVRLDSDNPVEITIRSAMAPAAVGYIALVLNPKFEPARSFEVSRVFTDNPGPAHDRRLTEVRHTDSFFTVPQYRSEDEWIRHAEQLRRQILVAAGLLPMPDKCPLNPQIFGRIDRGDYTVEKVYFESYPGFYVTGNLYRPAGKRGLFPGVACPHGHWEHGRLENAEAGSVPGRCINFARQGYVVFSYDMIGYNDSKQVEHNFRGTRETMWAIYPLGLQLWNSIRVLDFLSSLPDVDPERLGCTGASGGGTQTFLLAAVDDRVKVAAPVNMISAHFQGGCWCENAPGLRFNTNNMEFGAMMAPRPLLMVSATGDWTDETPRVEYPATKSMYELFGAGDRVHYVQINAGHNYNKASREAVYAWFAKWLLGRLDATEVQEQPFTVEKDDDLLVFARDERPKNALNYEGLANQLIAHDKQLLDRREPTDQVSLDRFRDEMGPIFKTVLAVESPEPNDLMVERTGRTKRQDYWVERLIIGRKCHGDQIPAIMFIPAPPRAKFPATLIVHSEGKAVLVDMDRGEPGPLVSGLLKRGQAVMAIDPFLTGEYNSPFELARRERKGNYFTTFNPTDDALRIQDVLTAVAYLQSRWDVERVNLVGIADAGIWCLLAGGFADNVGRTAIDLATFDPEDDSAWEKRAFVPGIRRVGGLQTAASLTAPEPLYLYNAHENFDVASIKEPYRAAGHEQNLEVRTSQPSDEELAEWLAR